MDDVKQWADRMKSEIGRVILGKEDVIEKVLTALLCGGHVLLEDVPGVGKTILARALSAVLGGKFQRIQCTPDLLPSDILGVSVYIPAMKQFRFYPGPIYSNIALIDEINRATPRCQSALLEAMESNAVTLEGKTMDLPAPFFLIATENPLDFEGTFPLPEAQKDRFFITLSMGYPNRNSELDIMSGQNRLSHPVNDLEAVGTLEELLELKKAVSLVRVPQELEDLILRMILLSRKDSRLEMGASPRAARALYQGIQALTAIRGREEASLDELHELALPILLKRIKLRTESILNGISEADVVNSLLDRAEQGELETA
jgi:MoxR-like ATPase